MAFLPQRFDPIVRTQRTGDLPEHGHDVRPMPKEVLSTSFAKAVGIAIPRVADSSPNRVDCGKEASVVQIDRARLDGQLPTDGQKCRRMGRDADAWARG